MFSLSFGKKIVDRVSEWVSDWVSDQGKDQDKIRISNLSIPLFVTTICSDRQVNSFIVIIVLSHKFFALREWYVYNLQSTLYTQQVYLAECLRQMNLWNKKWLQIPTCVANITTE